MLALFIIFMVMGALYLLFAFVKPPAFLEHLFRVPAIFVFLPDRYIMPVGRVFAGALMIGVGVYLQTRFG